MTTWIARHSLSLLFARGLLLLCTAIGCVSTPAGPTGKGFPPSKHHHAQRVVPCDPSYGYRPTCWRPWQEVCMAEPVWDAQPDGDWEIEGETVPLPPGVPSPPPTARAAPSRATVPRTLSAAPTFAPAKNSRPPEKVSAPLDAPVPAATPPTIPLPPDALGAPAEIAPAEDTRPAPTSPAPAAETAPPGAKPAASDEPAFDPEAVWKPGASLLFATHPVTPPWPSPMPLHSAAAGILTPRDGALEPAALPPSQHVARPADAMVIPANYFSHGSRP